MKITVTSVSDSSKHFDAAAGFSPFVVDFTCLGGSGRAQFVPAGEALPIPGATYFVEVEADRYDVECLEEIHQNPSTMFVPETQGLVVVASVIQSFPEGTFSVTVADLRLEVDAQEKPPKMGTWVRVRLSGLCLYDTNL